ncbi:MAG: alkaline phosphatase family protein [Anaerolineales bacterium]
MPHMLLLDIDGLRYDVFQQALESNAIPNIQKVFHRSGHIQALPLISTAPSITFCAQASIFTGAPPNQHGIAGNQFFDRFGTLQGKPRLFAFDIGDLMDFEDAVLVFSKGLASNCLQVPTIYEILQSHGFSSVVVGNMYARGADQWIKPSLVDLARLTKGNTLIGISAPDYDGKLLENTKAYLEKKGLPNLLTYYLKGLDDESHRQGIESQLGYLTGIVDPQIGELWDYLSETFPEEIKDLEVLLFSDHGQINVVPDEKHSVRMAFPFQNEFADLFEYLGFDLTDYPGEGPRSNAVIALDGGLAHVYLRKPEAEWAAPPLFEQDVIRTAKAFWQASLHGAHAPNLQGSLDSILVRNAEKDGWSAPYQAITPEGDLLPLEEWAAGQVASGKAVDPLRRLSQLAGPYSGDLLLIANYAEGFFFSPILKGVHGGIHPEDSTGILAANLSTSLQGIQQSKEGELLSLTDIASLVYTYFGI